MLLTLAGGGALLAWLAARGQPRAALWAAAFGVVGLVLTGVLVDRAPPSKAVLAQRMDQLPLPFFVLTEEARTGHSWCRPHCPVVERTYRAPDTADQATLLTVGTALYHRRIVRDAKTLARIGAQPGFRVAAHDVDVSVSVDPHRGGSRTVHIRYASHR